MIALDDLVNISAPLQTRPCHASGADGGVERQLERHLEEVPTEEASVNDAGVGDAQTASRCILSTTLCPMRMSPAPGEGAIDPLLPLRHSRILLILLAPFTSITSAQVPSVSDSILF